jgi:hypothetical protein
VLKAATALTAEDSPAQGNRQRTDTAGLQARGAL